MLTQSVYNLSKTFQFSIWKELDPSNEQFKIVSRREVSPMCSRTEYCSSESTHMWSSAHSVLSLRILAILIEWMQRKKGLLLHWVKVCYTVIDWTSEKHHKDLWGRPVAVVSQLKGCILLWSQTVLTKKQTRLLFNFTCRWFDWSAGDFRTPCVPLLTSWQACASLSEWSSRVSHLYNTHKATVKFKNSLTDEPGTPWAPTVSVLSPLFVAARNHFLSHLLVWGHRAHVLWHAASTPVFNQTERSAWESGA